MNSIFVNEVIRYTKMIPELPSSFPDIEPILSDIPIHDIQGIHVGFGNVAEILIIKYYDVHHMDSVVVANTFDEIIDLIMDNISDPLPDEREKRIELYKLGAQFNIPAIAILIIMNKYHEYYKGNYYSIADDKHRKIFMNESVCKKITEYTLSEIDKQMEKVKEFSEKNSIIDGFHAYFFTSADYIWSTVYAYDIEVGKIMTEEDENANNMSDVISQDSHR